jgi:hypothetical protein
VDRFSTIHPRDCCTRLQRAQRSLRLARSPTRVCRMRNPEAGNQPGVDMTDRSNENVPRGDHVPGGLNDASSAEMNQKAEPGTDSVPERGPLELLHLRFCTFAAAPLLLQLQVSHRERRGAQRTTSVSFSAPGISRGGRSGAPRLAMRALARGGRGARRGDLSAGPSKAVWDCGWRGAVRRCELLDPERRSVTAVLSVRNQRPRRDQAIRQFPRHRRFRSAFRR